MVRRRLLHARTLGSVELRLDRDDDARRDLVLEREEVGQRPLVALDPDFASGAGIGEVHPDADTLAGPLDAAFEDVAHAEFAADLLHVDRSALVCEGRIAGDDEEAARSEEHTSELQSRRDLVCRLLLEKKKTNS